jgi:hypothetical protein
MPMPVTIVKETSFETELLIAVPENLLNEVDRKSIEDGG